MKVCPTCQRRIDDHDLEQAFACLEVIALAAHELAARACGGAAAAQLERELVRPSVNWRS